MSIEKAKTGHRAANPDKLNAVEDKRTGWGARAIGTNLPTATPGGQQEMSAARLDVVEAIGNAMTWIRMKPVTTEEECADRLNKLFQTAADSGELVSVEKLALALGILPNELPMWESGLSCSFGISRQIKTAKAMIQSIEAELVNKGRIPVVSYIFRAKNFFGMRDQLDVVPVAVQQGATVDELSRLYAETGAGSSYDEVDTEFSDSDSDPAD